MKKISNQNGGEEMDEKLVELAKDMYGVGAFQMGDFVLASGKRSPFYINQRPAFRQVGFRGRIAQLMIPQIESLEYKPDRLADIPEAATPLVTTISDITGIDMVSPQVKAKDHGMQDVPVQGIFEPGMVVVLIDDLITTSGSKRKAIDLLTSVGLIVRDVFVVIDRCEGGREELAEIGVTLHWLITQPELLEIYLTAGFLRQDECDSLRAYMERSRAAHN